MAKQAKKRSAAAEDTSATVGYEAQLWQMADALRGSMDAAECKHVCVKVGSERRNIGEDALWNDVGTDPPLQPIDEWVHSGSAEFVERHASRKQPMNKRARQ